MPTPRFCRNPACSNHTSPTKDWNVRIGTYTTLAHGKVQRYRCRKCGTTTSDQSESIHYYAKRRLPIPAVIVCFNSGSSLREIGRRYGYSCAAIRNGVLRIRRRAMATPVVFPDETKTHGTDASLLGLDEVPRHVSGVPGEESGTARRAGSGDRIIHPEGGHAVIG